MESEPENIEDQVDSVRHELLKVHGVLECLLLLMNDGDWEPDQPDYTSVVELCAARLNVLINALEHIFMTPKAQASAATRLDEMLGQKELDP